MQAHVYLQHTGGIYMPCIKVHMQAKLILLRCVDDHYALCYIIGHGMAVLLVQSKHKIIYYI